MSIFDLDYINTVWRLLVPPDKRGRKWLAWGAALMQHQNNFHQATFSTYSFGPATSVLPYDSTRTYHTLDGVVYANQRGGAYYGDNCVYRALSIHPDGTNNAGFRGIPPVGDYIVPDIPPPNVIDSTSALNWITNDFGQGYYWIKTQENFIGANIRVSFSAQKLIYEYALNKWFHTTFRQPDGNPEDHTLNPAGTPDIYINTNVVVDNQFYFYPYTADSFFLPATNFFPSNNPISQYFFSTNTFPDWLLGNYTVGQIVKYINGNTYICILNTTFDQVPTDTTYWSLFSTPFDFTIYIPVAYYNALVTTVLPFGEIAVTPGNNSPKRDAALRSFADQYCPAGAFYNIITY